MYENQPQYTQQKKKEEGKVTLNINSDQKQSTTKANFDSTEGEYVDFEEIK